MFDFFLYIWTQIMSSWLFLVSCQLNLSAADPGHAARAAEERKRLKYLSVTDRHVFVPVAVETSGVIGPSATTLLREIGHRLCLATDEPRQTEYLMQRVSLAIVRGNTFAITTSARQNL